MAEQNHNGLLNYPKEKESLKPLCQSSMLIFDVVGPIFTTLENQDNEQRSQYTVCMI